MKRILALICVLSLTFMCFTAYAGEDTAADADPIVLKVGSSFNEGSIIADSLEHMCQLIEEATNGQITFERYYGGTLYTLPEEFKYLTSGAVDLASPMQGTASMYLPDWQIAALGVDAATGVDISNYIANEDETTAPLLQAQAEAAGIHAFGFNIGDYNVIACRAEASSIEDLKGRAFGVPAQGAAVYEAFGLNCVTTETADAYESLSRGVVDTFVAGISSVCGMKLYESCETCLILPCTGGTGICSMNLDTWNSLTSEQQEIFTQAYNDTIEWMKDRYDNELMPSYVAEMEEKCSVVTVEGEELASFMETRVNAGIDSYIAAAETLGCLDEYNMIQETAKVYADSVNNK